MSNTGQELFELCKEVYKRTGWYDLLEFAYGTWHGTTAIQLQYMNEPRPQGFSMVCPLYTSDYLLEKLRRPVSINFLHKPEEVWANDSLTHLHGFSSTTLKALLKLVIALDNAGVNL